MGLKFRCKNCGEDVVVRFLKVGEAAECKNCGASNPVPESAESTDDETAASYQSRARRSVIEVPWQEEGVSILSQDVTGPGVYFLAAIFLIVGIYLLAADSYVDSYLGALVAYWGCGLAWFASNRKMPLTAQIIAPVWRIILFWPLGFLNRLRKLRDPSRFTVNDENAPGESLGAFSSWDEALAFAKNRAAFSGRTTWIVDHARYRKTIIGTYMHRFYFVKPSGELTKPSF